MKTNKNELAQHFGSPNRGVETFLINNWFELATKFTNEKNLIEKLRKEIVHQYTSPNRHYHTLHHLHHLIEQAEDFQDEINDLDTIKFSIWYHDIIYDVSRKDNEEKSADLAGKRMLELGIGDESIKKCRLQILASKGHLLDERDADNDTNFFLDFDLSILGAPPEKYCEYTQQIRKEYQVYPDSLYNKGRMKVLKHFLDSDRIFKTDYFFSHYEKRARLNLKSELDKLNVNGEQ